MDEIEAEARAYVEAYGDQYASGTRGAFDYLVVMLKVVDELRAPPDADVTNQGYEASTTEAARWSPGLWPTISLLRQEISRLRAPPGADVLEHLAQAMWEAREDIEVEATNAPHRCQFEADNPEIMAMARAAMIVLQQCGDERAAAAIESLREPTMAMRIAGDHFEGDTVGTWRAMFNAAKQSHEQGNG